MRKVFISTVLILIISACNTIEKQEKLTETEKWKLGWRIIASNMDGNYQLGELQFDSLLSESKKNIESKFLNAGFEILYELDKKDKIIEIFESQDAEKIQDLCNRKLFAQNLKDIKSCNSIKPESVGNPKLQLELIKMYVDDQASRGNLMEEIIAKFNLDKSIISNEGMGIVDGRNRQRLKEIFNDVGFPSKEMVGKDAMHGIFLMIQHSDGDKDWQKSQLPNIEKAVKNGDMDGQNYAYLYDRIKINSGEKQRYGTQFSDVDPLNKTVELAETEDLENLDRRRMEMGMMPIEMYKEIMLRNIKS